MKDKKGNNIRIGDRIKVLWGFDNREYVGNVIDIREHIALIATKDHKISVSNPSRLLKL